MNDYRHSPEWDWTANRGASLPFRSDAGELARQDVKRRAMAALTEATSCGAVVDVEGPLWALVDLSGGNARVIDAASWFRVAVAYGGNDELRADRCREAHGMMQRALRLYV